MWSIPFSDITWCSVEGSPETYVLHIPSARVMVLSATGSMIWAAADDAKDNEEVAQRLVEQIGEHPPTLDTDIELFIQHLTEAGLLVSRGNRP